MAIHPTNRAEPIPGYTLIEPLGTGGFGEVWKAQAPGGIPKAIKFVKGNLAQDEGKIPAAQELKSLNRVKNIHHPFILGLERVDIVDGQLIIVMELADRTLFHRLEECQGQGLAGVPRAELLRYMEETAEALDLMNVECQLQHLDIKPQNLFLVHQHVKVADFGLVKDLEGMTATVTSGITPIYAAPETFEGKVSRFSDQYSLAIVYQELLTGQRPFNGKNARMLLMQHVKSPPDLSALPEGDREIVGRALSKKATDRWPTCLEFVAALKRVRSASLPAVADVPAPAPHLQQTKPYAPGMLQPAASAPAARKSTVEPELRVPRATWQDVDLAAEERPRPPSSAKNTRPNLGFHDRTPSPPPEAEQELPAPPDDLPPWPKSSADTVEMSAKSKDPTVRIEKKDKEKKEQEYKEKKARAVKDMPCPRCETLLIDPGPMAWCGNCGYQAGLHDDARETQAPEWLLPPWAWVVVGGIGVMGVLVAVERLLPASIRPEAVSGALLLVFGLGAMLFATWALVQAWPGKKRKKKSKKTHIRKLPPRP
ncbi:MAG: serine/threonine protein kinase [Planctomycetia bacterium]|nr:serine/threonine protein kinase [Planctomycetia bacterium]